jgi:hypothetical protein
MKKMGIRPSRGRRVFTEDTTGQPVLGDEVAIKGALSRAIGDALTGLFPGEIMPK